MQLGSLPDEVRRNALLEAIFTKYYRQMEYVAFSVLQNRQDAEDAVQNAFIALSGHIDTLCEMEDFRLYYYVTETAKHKAIDLLRSRKPTFSYDEMFVDIDDGVDVAESLINKDSADKLLKCIKELPDKYRDVLALHYVNDLSNAEIAEIVGRSSTTVRKQLQRGRELLYKRWTESSEYHEKD